MLVKLVIFALVAFALYRMFMNDRNKKTEDTAAKKEQMVATGEMVKDPVCGAFVEPDVAISVRDGDKVTHFCSYECRDKFIKQLEEQGKIES